MFYKKLVSFYESIVWEFLVSANWVTKNNIRNKYFIKATIKNFQDFYSKNFEFKKTVTEFLKFIWLFGLRHLLFFIDKFLFWNALFAVLKFEIQT